ncbi:hypothetical protein GE09DRAFT_1179484 [Coniochaeta sp. 2T2.1]|nr:hypothetical protein GE09DRAFT_1179484 [Coniochaeta sp. 2T2.1]
MPVIKHSGQARTPVPEEAESPARTVKGSASFGPSVTSVSSLAPAQGLNPPKSQTWSPAARAPSPQPGPSQPKAWQTALTTTRDLALRLVPQNTTSTKHYTILLHSSPLIVYRGPMTNITLTIFSSPSHPLPPPESRTLHLQPRGYSGDTGSRLKAFIGFTESWVDVTPAVRVPSPTDVEPSVAKRWETDIARATKRLAKNAGKHGSHVARETHVVRIPAAAQDGYFRVVVCHTETSGDKKKHKVLCAGPMVRIASLSNDAARFRGAKLRTLPLEAGIQAATVFANNTVGTFVGPVVETVQGKIEQYQPGFAATTAGEVVYGATLQDKVAAVDEKVEQAREERYRTIDLEDASARNEVDVVGPDEGPEPPFPVKFKGKVVRGTGKGTEKLGVPTANLSEVPEDMKFRLNGVYLGWARLLDKKGAEIPSEDWHEAIISFGPSPYASPSVVQKTIVAVHILHNFDEPFVDSKLQVIVMGFLRPMKATGTQEEEMLDAITQDLWLTMSSLNRENWGPHGAVEKIRTLQSSRSFSDKYVNVREKVQSHIDRIPAHWVGVRTAGVELRDQALGNGGYWIAR